MWWDGINFNQYSGADRHFSQPQCRVAGSLQEGSLRDIRLQEQFGTSRLSYSLHELVLPCIDPHQMSSHAHQTGKSCSVQLELSVINTRFLEKAKNFSTIYGNLQFEESQQFLCICSVALLTKKSLINVRQELKAAPLLQNADVWFISTQAFRAQEGSRISIWAPPPGPYCQPYKSPAMSSQVLTSFLRSGFCLHSSIQTHPTFGLKHKLAKPVKNPWWGHISESLHSFKLINKLHSSKLNEGTVPQQYLAEGWELGTISQRGATWFSKCDTGWILSADSRWWSKITALECQKQTPERHTKASIKLSKMSLFCERLVLFCSLEKWV